MTSSINAIIEQRISANQFDPTKALSAAQIKELVRLATRAPTASLCSLKRPKSA